MLYGHNYKYKYIIIYIRYTLYKFSYKLKHFLDFKGGVIFIIIYYFLYLHTCLFEPFHVKRALMTFDVIMRNKDKVVSLLNNVCLKCTCISIYGELWWIQWQNIMCAWNFAEISVGWTYRTFYRWILFRIFFISIYLRDIPS